MSRDGGAVEVASGGTARIPARDASFGGGLFRVVRNIVASRGGFSERHRHLDGFFGARFHRTAAAWSSSGDRANGSRGAAQCTQARAGHPRRGRGDGGQRLGGDRTRRQRAWIPIRGGLQSRGTGPASDGTG